jgi:carbonic anhydrase
MSDLQTLLDRNRQLSGSFDQGDLPILPRLSTLILTCLDARVDPAHFFGLELGEAFVMRSIGGRVTDPIIEQIAILNALAGLAGGGALELMVIHHTDCGTIRFADPQVRERLGEASGSGEAVIEGLAATDPETSAVEDVERLRAAPNLPDELVVSAYVYDVTDGQVREVVAPASLRTEVGS